MYGRAIDFPRENVLARIDAVLAGSFPTAIEGLTAAEDIIHDVQATLLEMEKRCGDYVVGAEEYGSTIHRWVKSLRRLIPTPPESKPCTIFGLRTLIGEWVEGRQREGRTVHEATCIETVRDFLNWIESH